MLNSCYLTQAILQCNQIKVIIKTLNHNFTTLFINILTRRSVYAISLHMCEKRKIARRHLYNNRKS